MSRYSRTTVTAIVIANMVGTGVFTSLGFQLADIRSGFALIALWVTGGLIALCGALSYAELGSALPRSGGEYNFLRQIYSPAAGFVSGWVSATVGFTAPVALAALTFSAYASAAVPWLQYPLYQKAVAALLIVLLSVAHAGSHRNSSGLQNTFTLLKIAVILLFCAAIFMGDTQPVRFLPGAADLDAMRSGAFAVALIYVSYSYTGWNAATYLAGEVDEPQRNLPRILVTATVVVTVLYVLLNAAFLSAAPMAAMTGEIEIGVIAARSAFGDSAGAIAGGVLALLLISTVSAMTVAGPRVLQVIGEDYAALRILARRNKDDIPYVAVRTQALGALLMIALADFQSILVFTGFTLALNSLLTVLALLVLRFRQPGLERPFRVPLYPVTPLIFLALTGWTLIYVFMHSRTEAWVGLALISSGLLAYALSARLSRGKAL